MQMQHLYKAEHLETFYNCFTDVARAAPAMIARVYIESRLKNTVA